MGSMIWAIVLAAGESKRMNAPKMLLPFRGSTILETTIGNIAESEVSNIMVVLGAYSKEILSVVDNMPVTYCINDKYKDGMLSSVKCGFRNLPPVFESVLVFPGDQPLISPGIINEVIKAWRRTSKGIVVPVYRKKRGHPLLIDYKYREEINRLDADKGLRSLAEKYPDDVFEVETDSKCILKDIDNKEDYFEEMNKTY